MTKAKDYGRPDRADENRELVERRLREVTSDGSPHETLTIEWRGHPIHLDVVQLPVGNLYYNPGTHRIQAQRGHDPQQAAQLEEDPWSSAGQDYLGHLLKALPSAPSRTDPEFTALMESLQQYGQSDPGLVTRDGVLVNGNTRRAALIKLAGPSEPMRVAVLPESCDWDDIADVELSLQLRKEHRRDYSYINRLLAVQELVDRGTPLSVIATTFRTTTARCKQDQWVYSCISSLIERSAAEGVRLSWITFEDHAEKLRELHRAYLKQQEKNPDKAELLVESRIMAMLLGFAKTDVRYIEPGFEERYLSPVLPPSALPEATAAGSTASVSIPGLGRTVKGPSAGLATARSLTDVVLKARAIAEGTVSASLPQQDASAASRQLASIREAVDQALDVAGRDARVRKRKQAAPARLADASRNIEQCVTDLVMSRASRSLDEEAFDDAVMDLRKALEKLARESQRTVKDPGDGVAWMIDTLGKGN